MTGFVKMIKYSGTGFCFLCASEGTQRGDSGVSWEYQLVSCPDWVEDAKVVAEKI